MLYSYMHVPMRQRLVDGAPVGDTFAVEELVLAETTSGQKRDLREEILRRRTFAIISHPDAGKTTLTEMLLLYGGANQTAGMVKG